MSKGLSNTFLAFKVICLAGDLTETDKRVGGALIEHYNRKSGRCDPSVGRIALLLNVHERSVQRSVRSLTRKGYINLTRHGGFGNRNSYELHWEFLREEDTAWNRRFRNLRTELVTSVSPQGRQEGRSGVGPDATLTCLNNLTPLTGPLTLMNLRTVYLAGPGVFRRDADAYGAALKRRCRELGFEPLWPLDNKPEATEPAQIARETHHEKGRRYCNRTYYGHD